MWNFSDNLSGLFSYGKNTLSLLINKVTVMLEEVASLKKKTKQKTNPLTSAQITLVGPRQPTSPD